MVFQSNASLDPRGRSIKTYPWLLFHPNIPKPLHGMAPRIFKGEGWWKQTKAKAKKQFNFHCWACGVHQNQSRYHQWLEAHECYSMDYSIGKVEYKGTSALCHSCHNYIHDGRMLKLFEKGEFSLNKYEGILVHGNAVLEAWFEENKWQWRGYKVPREAFTPYFNVYPDLPAFSVKIQWSGLPTARWNDYHMVIDGETYRSRFKTAAEHSAFYN